jgi:TfoX/Sxy family transcriptional regulator of competence genes
MASNKDYLEFVLELLREVRTITYKKMMGEYMLYKDGVLFGGIYDNRFLIKKTKSLESSGLKEQIPYPNAKAMLLVDSEDPDEIKDLVDKVIDDLR